MNTGVDCFHCLDIFKKRYFGPGYSKRNCSAHFRSLFGFTSKGHMNMERGAQTVTFTCFWGVLERVTKREKKKNKKQALEVRKP